MDFASPQELVDHITAEVRSSLSAVEFSRIGLQQFASDIQKSLVTNAKNPDPTVYIGEGEPNDPASKAHASWRLSEILSQAGSDGRANIWLSQQWIVAMYSKWEHEFRPLFSSLCDVPVEEVQSDLFGDLRHLRNDVVHHSAVATASNSGKCKLLGFFEPGDVINLVAEHFLIIRSNLEVRIG